jgi:hypothetical protein
MSFQLSAAKLWLERAKESNDVYAQFLLYFSGFNALFFLCGRIDNVKRDKEQIAKFSEPTGRWIANARFPDGKRLQLTSTESP